MASTRVLGACCLLRGAGATDETCSMLQHTQPVLRRGDKDIVHSNSEFSCATLTHHGAFSTVDVAVGTPAQVFRVVADTGSDSVIIPSCVCQDLNNCHAGDRCFTGTGHSSSFRIEDGPAGPPAAVLTFGSGPIKVAVASDLVRVGKVEQDMKDGVLLMVDQELDFGGSFEGILGLGLPTNAWPASEVVAEVASTQIQYALMSNQTSDIGDSAKDSLSLAGVNVEAKHISRHNLSIGFESAAEKEANQGTYEETGFLESAGVSRFSMCFNEGSAGGALRLNPPVAERTLGNVGHDHWAVDFRGVSIGESTGRVNFCGVEGMKPGQETPCAGIPDSGTTAIMGPQGHIDLLFESLCDGWDRCKQNYTEMRETSSTTSAVASKAEMFQFLLHNCAAWMEDVDTGINELPPINFGLRGSDGTEQEVKMPAWSYVTTTLVPGGGQICEPVFSAMDYNTEKNGPVWIFGSPFFFTHEVGYDLQTSPPGISFTSIQESSCGSCDDGSTASLVSGSAGTVSSVEQRHRRPRMQAGPRRSSSIDTSKPL